MGNVCCGSTEEKKSPALSIPQESDADVLNDFSSGDDLVADAKEEAVSSANDPGWQARAEEKARLDLIVQATGRSMVPVRSTRGSNYYDQGFGAAFSQHLEQTTSFSPTIPNPLPEPSKTDSVYNKLIQPQWEMIQLGAKGGMAGCAGENPNIHLDHICESYLDTVLPKKERLFAGAEPIVENLL